MRVTEKGLDQWLASLYGLNVDNFPGRKPDGMPKALFHELFAKYLKNENRLTKGKISSKVGNSEFEKYLDKRNTSRGKKDKTDPEDEKTRE